MGIEDASDALRLIMRRHEAVFWQARPDEGVRIAVPIKGRGNPTEWRPVGSEMLLAAQRQVETGTPAFRGELDFPEPPLRRPGGPHKCDRRKSRRQLW